MANKEREDKHLSPATPKRYLICFLRKPRRNACFPYLGERELLDRLSKLNPSYLLLSSKILDATKLLIQLPLLR